MNLLFFHIIWPDGFEECSIFRVVHDIPITFLYAVPHAKINAIATDKRMTGCLVYLKSLRKMIISQIKVVLYPSFHLSQISLNPSEKIGLCLTGKTEEKNPLYDTDVDIDS